MYVVTSNPNTRSTTFSRGDYRCLFVIIRTDEKLSLISGLRLLIKPTAAAISLAQGSVSQFVLARQELAGRSLSRNFIDFGKPDLLSQFLSNSNCNAPCRPWDVLCSWLRAEPLQCSLRLFDAPLPLPRSRSSSEAHAPQSDPALGDQSCSIHSAGAMLMLSRHPSRGGAGAS